MNDFLTKDDLWQMVCERMVECQTGKWQEFTVIIKKRRPVKGDGFRFVLGGMACYGGDDNERR